MSRDDDFSKGPRGEYSKVGQVKEVTSLTNPIVKDLRSLALKKFRDQQGVFLAEGLKLVIDALEQDWRIKTLVFAKSGKGNKMVEQVAARTFAKGGLVLEVTEKVISAITRRDNPQMVVGVFEQAGIVRLQASSRRATTFISRSTAYATPAIWAPSSVPPMRSVPRALF
jgi:TrmH family RNA methyltransferase